MLTGGTSKEDSRSIFARLTASSRPPAESFDNQKEIKLCYVTVAKTPYEVLVNYSLLIMKPEKIAKSKTFVSLLEKLARAGKLCKLDF